MAERRYEEQTRLSARPEDVWAVLIDAEDWSTWTKSVRSARWLDSGPLAVGKRVRIEQPKLPATIWTVDTVDPGRRFTWSSRRPGLRTDADHRVDPDGPGCRVTVAIRHSGALAGLVGLLYGGLTRAYLQMETAGLARRTAPAADQ